MEARRYWAKTGGTFKDGGEQGVGYSQTKKYESAPHKPVFLV